MEFAVGVTLMGLVQLTLCKDGVLEVLVNVAVTVVAADSVTLQEPVPEQPPPLQPPNVEPEAAAAVRVTPVPLA